MSGDSQSSCLGPLQTGCAAQIESNRRLNTLLIGTTLILLLLRFFTFQPRIIIPESEPPGGLLSAYLFDTDFLTRCAIEHRSAIEQTEVLAPEIKVAILQLAAAQQRLSPSER